MSVGHVRHKLHPRQGCNLSKKNTIFLHIYDLNAYKKKRFWGPPPPPPGPDVILEKVNLPSPHKTNQCLGVNLPPSPSIPRCHIVNIVWGGVPFIFKIWSSFEASKFVWLHTHLLTLHSGILAKKNCFYNVRVSCIPLTNTANMGNIVMRRKGRWRGSYPHRW